MRAVIFDLDGTLIDSAPDIAASVNRVLAADGLAPHSLAAIHGMIGDGAKTLLERAYAAHGRQAGPRQFGAFIADYQAHPVAETVCYPGILEVVAALHGQGRPLGICTNKPMSATRPILEALGLAPFFSAVVGGDSTPYRKPDPRHLAATLAALEVNDAVMIGDHENDISAAAGLGLPAIHAGWGYSEAGGYGAAAGAAYTAATPHSLVEILAQMG